MTQLDDIRARHAAEIARAENELRIAESLPELGIPFNIVSGFGKTPAWVSYKARTPADILAIADAFPMAEMHDCKDRGTRGAYRDERGDCQGSYFCSVELQASVSGGQSAKFVFFPENGPNVWATLDGSDYGQRYQGREFHPDLSFQFINEKPRAVKYKQYSATGGLFLAHCATVINYSTGVHDGSSVIRKGFFATRDCLAAALETIRARSYTLMSNYKPVATFETRAQAETELTKQESPALFNIRANYKDA